MAEPRTGSVREKIVTLKSLEPPSTGFESTPLVAPTPEARLAVARYEHIMERLRQETQDAGPDVMVTVQDRDVSRLQSELARQAAAERALSAGGMEVKFGSGFAGGDWFGWIGSLLDHVDRREAHPLVRPTTITLIRCRIRRDWRSRLTGAPASTARPGSPTK